MSRPDIDGTPLSARFDEDTVEAIDTYARERGIHRSSALRRLVRAGLDVESRAYRTGRVGTVAVVPMEAVYLLAGAVGYSIGGATAAIVAVVVATVALVVAMLVGGTREPRRLP